MARIISTEDCGNAPKKQYVKDFLVAYTNGDTDSAVNMLANSVSLEIPGYTSLQGIEKVTSFLTDDAKRKVTSLTINNILSHGDRCAANGILKFEDGKSVAFCSVYVFDSHGKNAKLNSITTYSIEL